MKMKQKFVPPKKVIFDDEKWFAMSNGRIVLDMKTRSYRHLDNWVLSKFIKNRYTLDYREDHKTAMHFNSLNELKAKAAVMGIDAYFPGSSRCYRIVLNYPDPFDVKSIFDKRNA